VSVAAVEGSAVGGSASRRRHGERRQLCGADEQGTRCAGGVVFVEKAKHGGLLRGSRGTGGRRRGRCAAGARPCTQGRRG
jgi:hypothetical protein